MAKNFTKLNHKNFPLWKKNIRKNLSIEDKLIYFSLMANPQTDYRGIFEIETDDLIKTGVKIDKIENAFTNLETHDLIKYDEEKGIILVPEMVKTQKWGQNEIISLINYIKDEIDSFLILDLIDILQLLDLTDKAKGYLLELQGVSKGYQRGIKGEGVALPIDKIRIDIDKKESKKRVRKDTDIELDKEEKALLEKDAVDVYSFYVKHIKSGRRGEAIKLINDILKHNSKEELIICIQNYIIKQKETGVEIKYYNQPQIFFSKANEKYKDFLGYDLNSRKMFIKEVKAIDKHKGELFVRSELKRLKEKYINVITEEDVTEVYNIFNDEVI